MPDDDANLMYRLLVQGVTDYAIYMLTPDGLVANWNAGAERAKGYSANEIVGRHFSCFHLEEDRLKGLPEESLRIALRDGRYESEGWRLRKDRSRFWANVVIDAIYNDGRLIGFAKITRDYTEKRAMQEKARDLERRFRLLVQGVSDYAIYMLNLDGTVANWNAGAERAKGYKSAEIVGKHFSCFYPAADRDAGLPAKSLNLARDTGRFQAEGWRVRKDGSRFWANVVIDAIHDEDGLLIGFGKITRDCSEQRNASVALEAAKNNLDRALANIVNGVCLLDSDERIITYNPQFLTITQTDPAKNLVGQTLTEAFGHKTAARIRTTQLLPALATTKLFPYEMVIGQRCILSTTQALNDGGWVSTFEDFTDRRQTEKRILHMAHHDGLTGLPNRTALMARLEEACADMTISACGVLYLDLDRFKPVNDSLGHEAGDSVLQAVAARLRGLVRTQDTVARLGGDEFAILCLGRTGRLLAPQIAERMIEAINQPFMIGGVEVSIGASVGIAISPAHGETPDTLLQSADLALYEAKRKGRNCARFYKADLTHKMIARRSLELRLQQATAQRTFLVHYQPVVDFKTGLVSGFEALIRWRDADGAFVSPAEFVPVAEEIGLMPEIGRWILQEACRQAATWPAPMTVAVNVSATQFENPDFPDVVRAALAEAALEPHRLELEITETAVLKNLPLAAKMLEQLRAIDVQVALDDFGTGYSSLSFLQSLPFTRIKLDRSFVRDINTNHRSQAIVRAIAGLCVNLDIGVTAEGVETTAEHMVLAHEGCSHFQGYLISPARPPVELQPFLTGDPMAARAAA